MIFVDREKFSAEFAHQLERPMMRAYEATQKIRSGISAGEKPEFKPTIWSAFKPLLRRLFNAKCAYCETKVDSMQADIDTFRPKSIYPHLAYTWNNLLYTCAVCNRTYKKDLFPVTGNRQIGHEENEHPLLLNPCTDHPSEHLAFSLKDDTREVHLTGLTDKGRNTISILGLNRPELLKNRYQQWTRAGVLLRYLDNTPIYESSYNLKKLIKDDAPYAASTRQLLRAWIESHESELRKKSKWTSLFKLISDTTVEVSHEQIQAAGQIEEEDRAQLRSISVEDTSKKAVSEFNTLARRIERIVVKNLRAVSDLDFTFPATGRRESWVMLIGENGVGKSTILQAVALALMGQSRASAFNLKPVDFLRRGQDDGFVSVYLNSVGIVTLRFSKKSDKFTFDPPSPMVPLLAYGPTRLLPPDTKEKPLTDKNIRVDNLFKPTVPLSDAEDWLVETARNDMNTFEDVGRAMCRLLLITEKYPPRVNGDHKVEIKMPDGWRCISDLSAGYRSVLALAVDIAIGTSGKRPKPEQAVGIVLLDEIEVHLHPKWKISIVERLRKCFPQMSFLCTTHDPLCLKGLYDREIVVLRRGRTGKVTFATDIPSVDILNTDDILTSKELFELPSSRNRTSPITIARYSALLNKPEGSRTKNEQEQLKSLSNTIDEMFAGVLNPMQREVEQVITAVMDGLRSGKRGSKLTKDVLAEIRRQVSEMGRGQ